MALIASRFNETICEGLLKGAVGLLHEAGYGKKEYDIFRVPGAFEIPLAALCCARTKKYQGMVCLGAVIRGETPHFDFISKAVTEGVTRVALETVLPLSFGVITANRLDQAVERSLDNEYNKGREAVFTVLEMVDLLKKIG